jgi:hypothetical protein
MAGVEGRESSFAGQKVAVLQVQRIEALKAYTARGVDRFRPGVGGDDADASAEATGRFEAERVVTAIAAIVHPLDIAEARIGCTRSRAATGAFGSACSLAAEPLEQPVDHERTCGQRSKRIPEPSATGTAPFISAAATDTSPRVAFRRRNE